MANEIVCRVLIAYTSGLLGRGLQSLLERDGAFHVVAVSGAADSLPGVMREQDPQVIIVERGALSPQNAQAVLEATLAHPAMSVVSVSLHAAHPTLWRALAVAGEGGETVVDALRRHLAAAA